MRENAARQARFHPGGAHDEEYIFDDKENKAKKDAKAEKALLLGSVRRDFFGRIIQEVPNPLDERDANSGGKSSDGTGKGIKVWVTFHEGLNNAVRKPVSLDEFLRVM
jgi:chromosome transmission fidelity protein 18